MSLASERMLFIVPHPDDFEFGCGGWFARALEEGLKDACVWIGAWGEYTVSGGSVVTAEVRQKEAQEALTLLGVPQERFDPRLLRENEGYRADYGAAVGAIESVVREFRPTEVFIPLLSFNQDHRFVHDVAVTAFRPGNLTDVFNLWAYEYPGNCWGPEPPRLGRAYMQLEARHVEKKLEALRCHKSQFSGGAAGVTPEASETLMRQRGSEIGVDYAECFYLMREINKCR